MQRLRPQQPRGRPASPTAAKEANPPSGVQLRAGRQPGRESALAHSSTCVRPLCALLLPESRAPRSEPGSLFPRMRALCKACPSPHAPLIPP